MQIRHSLAKWEFWVWAHTWISTWIPGSHWAELGREERGEGIVMAITHWVLTKCPACNAFSLPGALLTFATPWNVGKIIRTLHIIQIELREGSDLLKITEGSDSFKASGAWDQARLTSGGWVLSEEERERERREVQAAEAHKAQRSRIPGCNVIRHPGGMHAQTWVPTWPLHSLCPLPGILSLQIATGSL